MSNNVDLKEFFSRKAKERPAKIGIAIRRPIPETLDSLKRASEYAELIVVAPEKIDGMETIVEADDEKASQRLITLLKEGVVEGIVRGQVKDSATLAEFYRQFNKEKISDSKKVCPCVVTNGEYNFVVGSASIYHAMTAEAKIYEAERIIEYMTSLDIVPKIGVGSSRRPSGVVGKYPEIEEVFERCQKLADHLRSRKYEVKEYYIEYEMAVWEGCNLILPATGLVGNAWLKALMYLGGYEIISCPYLDLGVVYEDGSRNEKDFFNHIIHAAAMVNGAK